MYTITFAYYLQSYCFLVCLESLRNYVNLFNRVLKIITVLNGNYIRKYICVYIYSKYRIGF